MTRKQREVDEDAQADAVQRQHTIPNASLSERTVVVDADELQAAWEDPKVQKVLADAREYGERLRREGRVVEL